MNTYNILTRDVNGYSDGLSLNSVLGNILAPGGTRYFVEGNAGNDSNDGLSWGSAFKTAMVAFAASNANIAASSSGWAARNQIFIRSDNNEASKETLITLPNKCDVIGVGSYDHKPFPEFIGNHVIGAGAYMGTRFFNIGFRSLAAGGAIMTVPTTTSGLAFLGCNFDGNTGVVATKGISAVAVEMLKIIGCNFRGLFSSSTIDLGAGSMKGVEINDNFIESGAKGINVSSSLTCTGNVGKILRNMFAVTGFIMDDDSDTLMFSGNRGFTLTDGKLASCLDYNADLASDNYFSCSGGTMSPYPVVTAAIPS